ncbi:glycosyltransferase family 4 protein [Candidatus Bathyarchaeota archaeon]|nr:glycosyltransferase family 4 protein [Candidatus Bathyarchaeota archaeon]
MTDLRVALTRAGDLSVPDGVNTYVLNLAAALAERDVEVNVVCGSNVGGVSVEGVDVQALSESNLNSDNSRRVLAWMNDGARALKRIQPDIIHFNGIVPVSVKGGKVATNHGLVDTSPSQRMYAKTLYNSYADFVICSTTAHKMELESLGVKTDKLVVISPGIETGEFENRSLEEREDALLFVNPFPNKNLETVVRSLKLIGELIPAITLYIVGEGDEGYLNTCMDLAEELGVRSSISHLGFVSRERLRDLLSMVKVVVAPSFYESFGYIVLEAMCSGTPVIGSDRITPDLLRPGFTRYAVAPEDHIALAEGAVELLSDQARWAELSANSLDRAKHFDNDVVVPQIIDLYERLSSGVRCGPPSLIRDNV